MAQQQIFTGRYQIVQHLARGGMAEVYLARDLLLDRPVALKVLFPEFSSDRSFVERFRREARAAANLNHPNIVSVYDWGEEGGTYFIVMEYVDGRTLRDLIRAEGPLHTYRAAEIGAEIAGGLDFAHRRGVIHRDIKPGNVLISSMVKVTDFGIARATDPQESLTQTGAVMGTATYFSPEQAQGLAVDPRSDVYSLGVVLYETVAGRPPFVGDSPVSIAYQHVRETAPPPSTHNPDVSADFDAVVMKAMAKNRENRYASAADLRADLLRFHHGQPVVAEPLLAAGAATGVMSATQVQPPVDRTGVMAAPATATRVTQAPPPEDDKPKRTGFYFVVLVVLLALLVGVLVLLARQLGVGSQAKVDVPQVVGRSEADATRDLSDVGLKVKAVKENNDAAAGQVFDQNPKPPAKLTKGSAVTIKVSQGPVPVDVPDVRNRKVDTANDLLTSRGFQVTVQNRADDKVPVDVVIDQDPKGGGQAPRGSTITLVVSTGREQVAVPNVVGREQSEAANILGQAGFTTAVIAQPSDTVAAGKVIRTDPAAPTPVAKGSTVTLIVSTGGTSTTSPTTPTTKLFGTTTTTKP